MDLDEVFVNGWVLEVDNYYHLDGINLNQTQHDSQDSGVFSDDDDSRETVCLSPISEDEDDDDLSPSPPVEHRSSSPSAEHESSSSPAEQMWSDSREISQQNSKGISASLLNIKRNSGPDCDCASHPSTRLPLHCVKLIRTSSLENQMMNLVFRRETEGKKEPSVRKPVDNKENQMTSRGIKRRRYSESSLDLQRRKNFGPPDKMKRSSSLNESHLAVHYELNTSTTSEEKKDTMRDITEVTDDLKSANPSSSTLEVGKYLTDITLHDTVNTVRKNALVPLDTNHSTDCSVQNNTKQMDTTNQDSVHSANSDLHPSRTTNHESVCGVDNSSQLIGSTNKNSECDVNDEPPRLVRLKCLSPGEKFRQTQLPMNTNPTIYEWRKVLNDNETPQNNPRKRLHPEVTNTSPPKVLKTSQEGNFSHTVQESVQESTDESHIFKIPTSLPPRKRSKKKPTTRIR